MATNLTEYSIEDDDLDYDKVINSQCYCGIGLPWSNDSIVMAYPCEHMYHERCFNKIQNGVCKLCGATIIKKLNMFDADLHHQRFADMLSVSYYDDMSCNTPGRFLDSVFDMASVFARMPFVTTRDEGRTICENIFSLNNLTMKVYGLEKIKLEKNKVYICNHVSHLELVVIFYLLGPGFLASSIAGQSKLFEQCKKVVPLLTFERGDKNRKVDLVEEMRKFVDEKGSICLFPEGMMKHPDALVRFRTGAFHIGRPLYAVTIRHNDIVSDERINGFLYKIGAKKDINIEVHILGPYYPPFTPVAIEKIRGDMARYGNMVMSRVSNRDIVDTKGKTARI